MSASCYRIKNWERFQHYNKPRPTWIKLHRSLLDDRDFQSLSTRSRALLVMLWLIAAESADGTIPDAKSISWRLRLPVREVSNDLQELSNYLEPLYTGSRDHLASDREEKRREESLDLEADLEKGKSAGKPAPKTLHLRYVMLTDDEYRKLSEKLNGATDAMIERLDSYIGQIGVRKAAKYVSHYDTILNWWRKDHPKQPEAASYVPKLAI